MHIAITKPLFAWDCLEDSPSLATVKEFLAAIPDAQLLESLRRARGKGRDDYPVHVFWGVAAAGDCPAASDHRSLPGGAAPQRGPAAADRHRSRKTRCRRSGICRGSRKCWDKSRTCTHLKAHLQHDDPAAGERPCRTWARTRRATPRRCNARRKPAAAAAEEVAAGLPQPSGGRKEYTDDAGNVTKVVEWFGYKLHLLGRRQARSVVGLRNHRHQSGRRRIAARRSWQAQAEPAARAASKRLAYDKAADTNECIALLARGQASSPVIQNRTLWKEEPERMLPGHDGNSNIVYDEAGTVHCYDRMSEPIVRHQMAYIGYEPRATKRSSTAARPSTKAGTARMAKSATRASPTARRSACHATIDLRRFPRVARGPPKNSSGSTKAARRSNASTPG